MGRSNCIEIAYGARFGALFRVRKVYGCDCLRVCVDNIYIAPFAPPEATQRIDGAPESAAYRYERIEPSGPLGLLVTTKGDFEAIGGDSEEGPSFTLSEDESLLGVLPLLTKSGIRERLLYLDSIMCIVESRGRTSVWVRPSTQKAFL